VKTLDCALFALAFAFVVAVIVPPAFAQVLGPIRSHLLAHRQQPPGATIPAVRGTTALLCGFSIRANAPG
jgi:hypothetical protein